MCRGREFHHLGDNDRNENLYVSVLRKCSVNVSLCLDLVCNDVWEWNSGMYSIQAYKLPMSLRVDP